MYIKTLLTIAVTILCSISFSQDSKTYSELTEEARILYEAKEYYKSGLKYSEAFRISENNLQSIIDRYPATVSWAHANEIDSAFVQFFILSQKLFSKEIIQNANIPDIFAFHDHILKDEKLESLHPDPRWEAVQEIMKKNKAIAEANLDMGLVLLLDSIFFEDQNCGEQEDQIEQAYGLESEEGKALLKTLHEKDSTNLATVEEIINERGWLGPDVIGFRGNLTLWLVIHHSNLEKWEKYTPMMRDAVAEGNARPDHLAYLEDRLALAQGKRQIYGSQLDSDPETGEAYVMPLEDPDSVDIRRAEVGLSTLQEYLSGYGMIWDVEEYKKRLPAIEEITKKRNVFNPE